MFKNIGIVGNGFVGNAMYQNFKNFVNVEVYDIVAEKSTVSSLQDLVDFAEVIFVSVPTPSNPDGSCNVTFVENLVKQISGLKKDARVVIKSTVQPGTSSKLSERFPELSVAFNPEFLTEANSYNDFRDQKLVVIGSENEDFRNQLREFYIEFVRKCSKVEDSKVVCVASAEAEMFKYLANCFLATKLTFANEIYDLCGRTGIDYTRLSQIAELDERLGKTHWKVPGTDGNRGWGGSCFPKDTSALTKFARINNSSLLLLEQAIDLNNKHRS